jgi:starch synthase
VVRQLRRPRRLPAARHTRTSSRPTASSRCGPWKAEQLGGGYRVSSFIERTAYEAAAAVIAVSEGMREDILKSYPSIDPAKVKVVHNGIDSQFWQRPSDNLDVVRSHGVDPDKPSVIFVGRITRQKGLPYLLRAAAQLPPEVQVVLFAGAPTPPRSWPRSRHSSTTCAPSARRRRLDPGDAAARSGDRDAQSAATVFACPSIYEPLGIVNLEAMACELPVVATATGGIPEVVVDGETGWLVPIEQVQDGTGTPIDPDKFVADLAAALNEAVSDPDRAHAFGLAGRRRAVDSFSWASIGDRTLEVYRSVLG